jgi:hypothetical protein
MRARTVLISIACVVGLALAGCSSSVGGSPQLPGAGGGGITTGDNGQSGEDASSTPPGDDGSDADPSTADPGSTDSGDGGDSGLPPATDEDQPLPTGGLPTGMPTDLSGIPGISEECLAVAGLLMSVGILFIAPVMGGQPLTQQQVDQAFAQMGQVPPELAQPMQVLHAAAVQAIGKSAAEAAQILESAEVSKAMDALSKYSDDKCGGS